MLFQDFTDALQEWRDSGGAMNFSPSDGWEVVDGRDLADRVDSVRAATVYALEMGGLSPGQIIEEMTDWTD